MRTQILLFALLAGSGLIAIGLGDFFTWFGNVTVALSAVMLVVELVADFQDRKD